MLYSMGNIMIFRILIAIICFNLNACETAKQICNTNACKTIAKEIHEFMDLTADPCKDFNKFACGGFEKKNTKQISQALQKPAKDLQDRIEKLLNGIKPTEDGFKTDEKVIGFYNACKFFRGKLNEHQLEHNWTGYMTRVLRPYIKSNMNKTLSLIHI